MYEPKFTYTDRVISLLVKLEHIRTQIVTMDLAYEVKHKLSQNSKAHDIMHYAHIIGVDVSLKDAERLSNGVQLENIPQTEKYLINNFRNALDFNRSQIADTYAELDMTILLHINKLILTSWRESWDARFRNSTDPISENEDNWLPLRDKTFDERDMQKDVIDLVNWYKDVSPSMTPAIRIGILIYRLFEIAPFVSGNKYTILATVDYLLNKNGLGFKVYSSFLRNFDQNEEKYYEMYSLSRKNFDATLWLETFLNNLIKDLNEVREEISKFIVEEEKSRSQPFLDLNKRQLKILRYLQSVPMIKREDYCQLMEVSTMTAFRDLNDLVRKKLLKLEGQGRGTRYRLSSM